jgi:ribosome-binding protein aMBF1 (putative translation factor)
MSNLCELCGKEAMGGTYQVRGKVLSVCSACSIPSDPLDPESVSPLGRLDSAVLAALDSEVKKIQAEKAQDIKNNKTAIYNTRKQELADEIAAIDIQIADISKITEVIK